MRKFILVAALASFAYVSGCGEVETAVDGAGKAVPAAGVKAAVRIAEDPTPVGVVSAIVGFIYDVAKGAFDAVNNHPAEALGVAAALGGGAVAHNKHKKRKKKKAADAAAAAPVPPAPAPEQPA